MIRKVLAALVVLTCLVVAPASAFVEDYRTYFTIGGGVSLLADIKEDHPVLLDNITVSSDMGFNGYVGFGRSYNDGRVEFTIGYHATDLDEFAGSGGATTDLQGDFQVATALLSVFWEFNKDGSLSPYFGLGIGGCHTRILDDTLSADTRDSALAGQFGLGFSFSVNENTRFDIGYRLLGIVEPDTGPLESADYLLMHSGNAALRFLY